MSKRRFLLFRIVLSCFISVLTMGVASSQEPEGGTLSGKELFIENRCVRCHTIGRGRFVGPDLAGIGGRYSKDEIKKWMVNPQEIYQSKGRMPVNEGYPPMPPLGVPPNQAEAIADYLLSVQVDTAQSSEGGVIKGRLINETTGEASAGVDLTLTAFLGDKPTDEKTTTTNGEGLFEFRDLPWDRSYALSLNYRGAEYVTDKMVFYPKEGVKTLDLPIYEPTKSDENISVNAAHMIVQISDERIAVAEIMIFHNGSKEIYVGKDGLGGGKREALRFDLPDGAADVELLGGLTPESVMRTKQGFVDNSSFGPGIRRIVYTYTLPYELGGSTFEKTLNYPTQGFVLLISDSGNEVKVDGLSGGDVVQIQESNFRRWTGENLEAGAKLRVEISTPLLGEDSLKWAALGAVVMLVGGSILYSFVIKRKEYTKEFDATSATNNAEEERVGLIREIAELDDRFEAKEIGEDEYKKLRARKKERLLKLTRRIRKS